MTAPTHSSQPVIRSDGEPSDPITGSAEATSWWGRMGPGKRVVVVIIGLLVGVNGVIAAIDAVVGRDPGGPTGSSYATGDDGVAAWADLLRARDVPVMAARDPLGQADLPTGATGVLVEPADPPTSEGVTALAEHVAAGGRVVAVGGAGSRWAGALVGVDLGWRSEGTRRPAPTGATLDGLTALEGEGAGSFAADGPLAVAAGPVDAPVVVAAEGLVAVADPTLLDNAHLATADNAALAVVLAGPGPVVFAEAEHGYGEVQGFGAIPLRWRLAALGLVIATLVGFWSVGQRLGPPERADRPLPPPRRAYVDALGAGLARAPDAHRSVPPDPGGPP